MKVLIHKPMFNIGVLKEGKSIRISRGSDKLDALIVECNPLDLKYVAVRDGQVVTGSASVNEVQNGTVKVLAR